MRKSDPADLWFGVVFGLIAVGVFALYAIVVWDSAKSPRFWSTLLPMLGMIFAVSVVRGPIERLGLAPRFLAWFAFSAVAFALFMFGRGEAFNPALAAGMGLGFATLCLIVDLIRSRRAAKGG